jgi:chemotaxis protein MotB
MGTHARVAVGVFLLVGAACQTAPDAETQANEDKALRGVVESQQLRIDKLTADRVALDRKVKELEAKLSKVASTEKIVEEAKGEMSESVRRVLEQFKGDDQIKVIRDDAGYRFVLTEAVLFGTGSTDLTDEGKGALGRVAEALQGGNQRISIEGHTDDVPVKKEETRKRFPRGNIELSVARAFSVYDYLIKEGGVEEDRVAVVGLGPHRPAVPNTSDMNRFRNRRVEIRVEER